MRRLIAQILVCAVGAIALVGLGSVSSALGGHASERATPADSTALANTRAQLADAQAALQRANQILAFSDRYDIPGDLAAHIYDIAVSERIPPAIGFQLVKVESGFQNSAESGAAAIGLTQLQVATARIYDATVDADDLMNTDTNLRLGFRYLHDLLDRFNQNVALALEAYNKGPSLVLMQQASGVPVEGRYSHAVMRGLSGRSE